MADDLNQPFIGYRSAGRRRAELNDRAASADAPLALLRGVASGVLGAPGDIESLVRMLPGLSEQTVLPTSRDVEARLPLRSVSQTPVGRAATELGTLGGGFYTGPGSPLRAIASIPAAVSHGAGEFARAAGGAGAHVVKPKGGNWLAGSVERAIEPMIPRTGAGNRMARETLAEMDKTYPPEVLATMSPETLAQVERGYEWLRPNVAVQDWLEKKLAKYIRNEMATPEDPLRLLADRGVTHIPEGVQSLERVTEWIPETLEGRRATAGFPRGGMSETTMGQGWEQLADEAIHNMPARMRVSPETGGGSTKALQVEQENPWLLKVPPETMTYGAYPVEVRQELGFEHLADELRNAINPASDLPENLRWKYQDLDKVTVPQAVQRVSDINAWRAAQKAEADLMRAQNAATHVVKEYPEQGFKWVELKAPKDDVMTRGEYADPTFDIPEAAQERIQNQAEREVRRLGLDDESDDYMYAIQDRVQELSQEYAAKNKPLVSKALEDALKYEGETMGHCVGGYCPDVLEGRSQIYSLRDKKGQPHVTIEVQPRRPSVEQAIKIAIDEGMPPTGMDTMERVAQIMADPAFGTQDIVQIKGKANRAPKEEYLPAVQDFVRSQNWGKVGDLKNTGLVDLEQAGVPKSIRGGARFGTESEYQEMVRRNAEDAMGGGTGLTPGAHGEGFALGGLVQKYADGGLVGSNIYNSDAMQDPASAYRFADGGQAGDVRAYADGGLVANSHTADFDPARIDAIVGDLNALNAG